MRHGNSYRKLGRDSQHRRALLRNMTTSFFEHGKVKTTVPKAKELRCIVEKMITLGKAGDLHSRRQAASYLFSEDALKRLFTEVSGRFSARQGGYTRIVKYGPRFGDGAEICQLELVDYWDHEGKASQEAKKVRLERKQKEAESKETTVVE